MRSPLTETVSVFLVDRRDARIWKNINHRSLLAWPEHLPTLIYRLGLARYRSVIHNLTLDWDLSLVLPEGCCNSFPRSQVYECYHTSSAHIRRVWVYYKTMVMFRIVPMVICLRSRWHVSRLTL